MSGRPGQIKKEIRVGLPRPRSMDLVMEPNFIAMKREILELLKNDEDDEH
jgi:NitT/TauT family transport system ATP-binding protein